MTCEPVHRCGPYSDSIRVWPPLQSSQLRCAPHFTFLIAKCGAHLNEDEQEILDGVEYTAVEQSSQVSPGGPHLWVQSRKQYEAKKTRKKTWVQLITPIGNIVTRECWIGSDYFTYISIRSSLTRFRVLGLRKRSRWDNGKESRFCFLLCTALTIVVIDDTFACFVSKLLFALPLLEIDLNWTT